MDLVFILVLYDLHYIKQFSKMHFNFFHFLKEDCS
jgi:hypothetical protein